MLRQFFKMCEMRIVGQISFVRMDSGSGVNPVVRFRKRDCRGQMVGTRRASDGEDGRHAGFPSSLEHGVAVFIELRILEVRVGVDDFQRGPVAPASLPASYDYKSDPWHHSRADCEIQTAPGICAKAPRTIAALPGICPRKMRAETPPLL